MVESVKRKVYEIVFQKIQTEILDGHFQVGDKLPSERDLAVQHGVSRNSIREAIRLLELNHLVEIRRGEGTFIRNSSLQMPSGQMTTVLASIDRTILYDMLELRLILESQCAALAAIRATASDLERMAEALEMMKGALDDEELGIQADLNFHLAIAEATHNQALVELITSLEQNMRNTIKATRNYRLANKDNFTRTFEEHKAIFIAVSRGESLEAEKLMKKHIRTIREEFVLCHTI